MASDDESWRDVAPLADARRVAGILTRMDRYRHHQDSKVELNVADLRLLWLFTDRHPRTLAEVASALRLEQSTVNRQVNAAMTDGLLTRERPSASSAYRFTPTDVGLDAFERDVTAGLEAYDAALAAMGPTDAATMLALMQRFLDEYGAVVVQDSVGTDADGANTAGTNADGTRTDGTGAVGPASD